MKNIKLLFICLFMLLSVVLFARLGNTVSAQGLWNSQIGMQDDIQDSFGDAGTNTDIRLVVANIISVFLGFLGIIFLILIIYAGFKWMMAGGNTENVEAAKKMLIAGIIGLIIIAAAYAIAAFVASAIVESTNS